MIIIKETRKHSSRMRTTRFSDLWGGGVGGVSLQRPHLDRDSTGIDTSMDRDPWTETLLDRDPPPFVLRVVMSITEHFDKSIGSCCDIKT